LESPRLEVLDGEKAAEAVASRASLSFRKYLLPGLIFQGVVIAGGYGTGRELVEYFMRFGLLGGLLGMFGVTLVCWALILAVTFEFSRKFRAYDYRTLLKKILGRLWWVFETLYLILLLTVLAVVGSAAGVLLRDNFGIPYIGGVFVMLLAIGFLAFKGAGLIEKFMSAWSILIYFVYACFLAAALLKFGPQIKQNLGAGEILPGWALGGFKYALYNLGVVPSVLFCLGHIEKRKEALASGLLAGVTGILPAFLFYLAVAGQYPSVIAREIPAVYVLEKTGIPALLIGFQVVLFGTLIQTGLGFIHAVNERVHSALKEKGKEFKAWQRTGTALALLLVSLGISSFGLIALVSQGYGSLSWGFFLFFALPLLTIGIYRIAKN
jgi:uncharacterized membrane protein YkvI